MEYIKNIEIKNFKSIRHQVIDGCKRINVFIGYPNVGKSNLLEALSLFSIEQTNFNLASLIRLQNLTTLFFNGDINKKIEIRVNGNHRYVGEYQNDYVNFRQQIQTRESAFEKNDSGFIDLNHEYDITIVKKFELRPDKSVVNFEKLNQLKENRLSSIKKYEFLKQIKYSDKGYSELLQPYGENLFNVISTNEELLKEVNKLFSGSGLEFLYDSRELKYTILKRIDKGIFTVPYELLADTLQRLIFYKSAIISNEDAVLLFEEPEAHMFPPYITKFTGDIWYNKENQYFIASHSPFVVNDFLENAKEELAVYILKYNNGETVINRLSDEQLTEAYQYGVDLFFNLESLIE